jgi:hypothetical protein
LLEARKIAAEYGTPDSQVDDGNLYFALSKCLEHIDAQPADPTGRAPCVRHCEATAFQIVIKNLRNEIERLEAEQRTEQEPVAWPCHIIEADFNERTITLGMECGDYKVGAGTHWLSTTPPAAPVQGWRADVQKVRDSLESEDWCGDEKMIDVLDRVLAQKPCCLNMAAGTSCLSDPNANCPLLATPLAQPAPTVQEPDAAALFREALAFGLAYGPEIPAHQWDEMREEKVTQLVARLTTPPAAPVPLTPEQRKNLWVSATIESPSHENCYYRGIADSEAYHGITKGQP